MNHPLRKVVVPAAGLGTRFLPATKAVPKEMLPIVDTPAIQLIVEEALAAGAEEVVVVNGRGKGAIEDHFDRAYELEDQLQRKGKKDLFEQVRRISDSVRLVSVRQKEPLGLGTRCSPHGTRWAPSGSECCSATIWWTRRSPPSVSSCASRRRPGRRRSR